MHALDGAISDQFIHFSGNIQELLSVYSLSVCLSLSLCLSLSVSLSSAPLSVYMKCFLREKQMHLCYTNILNLVILFHCLVNFSSSFIPFVLLFVFVAVVVVPFGGRGEWEVGG